MQKIQLLLLRHVNLKVKLRNKFKLKIIIQIIMLFIYPKLNKILIFLV